MKLAFIGDNDLPSIERDAQFARQHGFAGIEFNHWHTLSWTDQTVDQIRGILDQHRLKVSMLGVWGINPISPIPDERQKSLDSLHRTIDVARQLGAETLVTGTGDIPDASDDQKIEQFQKTFAPIFEQAGRSGISMVFYTVHPGSFLYSLATCEKLWAVVPQMKLKFDPANWQHAGHDYLDVLHRYGHKVGYLHVKEHLHHAGKLISEPAAGMGDIAWGKIFAFLHEHNYDGWLSLEPHGPLWSKPPLREKMLLLSQRYVSQFIV